MVLRAALSLSLEQEGSNRMSDFTPKSPWLKAGEDIESGQEQVLTVKSLSEDEVGQDKEVKWVLRFKETDKKLVLNKGMQTALAESTGVTDSDEVAGKKITIFVDDNVRNPNTNKVGSAVRIRAKAPKAGAAKATKPADDADNDLGV